MSLSIGSAPGLEILFTAAEGWQQQMAVVDGYALFSGAVPTVVGGVVLCQMVTQKLHRCRCSQELVKTGVRAAVQNMSICKNIFAELTSSMFHMTLYLYVIFLPY